MRQEYTRLAAVQQTQQQTNMAPSRSTIYTPNEGEDDYIQRI